MGRDEIEIRPERPDEYHETECMTRRAFFNKYRKGCDEHYLVHVLRPHADYLPGLSRVAVKDGKVIGAIFYSRSCVSDGAKRHETVTFGPLCVDPAYQGRGVGEMLIKETLPLAAEAGYPGVIIFGEPDYYPRVGFRTNDHFSITTADGKNFSAFMGLEAVPGGFEGICGKFHESNAFENIDQADVHAFDRGFPPIITFFVFFF
ncbi:MAG: N-acetyltransferase, partial [Clostridia bacterium]|nr:N-acetyltransferase [Clostridia bacterium]